MKLELTFTLLLLPVLFNAAVGITRAIGCLAFLLTLSAGAAPPPLPPRPNPPQVKLEKLATESTNRILLIKLKGEGLKGEEDERIALALGLKAEKHPARLKRWRQFSIPPGLNKREVVQTLKQSGRFEHIQEPLTYTTQDTLPNDPLFPSLWGLTNIAAPQAWDRIKDAADVVVAVVDTGIDFTHPDLAANLWTGPNGEHGYTFLNNEVTPGGLDDHDHGTHVAGTIAAVGNNALGITGLAWRAKLIAIKVLHQGSGNSVDLVNGLVKIVELKEAGVPIRVSNHSYGAAGTDAYMEDGFRLLAEADVFAAVAAGNNNQNIDERGFYPAAYAFPNIVSTAASDSQDRKASFSNFGLVGSDIAAPGVSILSTTRSNTYSSFNGTSMAAPHVCGLALLVRALYPALTADQTRQLILHPASYDPVSILNNTAGRINAAKTLANPKALERPFVDNRPPVIQSVTPYLLITNSQPVALVAQGADPDGDALRWFSTSGNTPVFLKRLLALGGFSLGSFDNATVVAGGPFAYQLSASVSIAASDRRGGGVFTHSGFEFARQPGLRRPIKIKQWTGRTNETHGAFFWTFDVDDPAKSNYLYGVIWTFPDYAIGSSWFGLEPSTNELVGQFNKSTARCSARVFVMDRWLNYLCTETLVFPPNSTTQPRLVLNITTNQGNVPFDVTFDMRASQRADYWTIYDAFTGESIFNFDPVQTKTFATVGTVFRQINAVNQSTGEQDVQIVPIFASRFLGAEPPPRLAKLTIHKAPTVAGPWATFTNFSDVIAGDAQYYRLDISQ